MGDICAFSYPSYASKLQGQADEVSGVIARAKLQSEIWGNGLAKRDAEHVPGGNIIQYGLAP
jgi:hypothetical protein